MLIVFWKNGDHYFRNTSWISYLEEGMLVCNALLTIRAEVEILANSTFITDSCNRINLATITLDLIVNSKILVWKFFRLFLGKTFNYGRL